MTAFYVVCGPLILILGLLFFLRVLAEDLSKPFSLARVRINCQDVLADLRNTLVDFFCTGCERPSMPGWTLQENVEMSLRQLPVRTWNPRQQKSDDDASCAICLEEWREGDKQQKLPRCRHKYHPSCLQKWTSSQIVINKMPCCPLCASQIRAPDIFDHPY